MNPYFPSRASDLTSMYSPPTPPSYSPLTHPISPTTCSPPPPILSPNDGNPPQSPIEYHPSWIPKPPSPVEYSPKSPSYSIYAPPEYIPSRLSLTPAVELDVATDPCLPVYRPSWIPHKGGVESTIPGHQHTSSTTCPSDVGEYIPELPNTSSQSKTSHKSVVDQLCYSPGREVTPSSPEYIPTSVVEKESNVERDSDVLLLPSSCGFAVTPSIPIPSCERFQEYLPQKLSSSSGSAASSINSQYSPYCPEPVSSSKIISFSPDSPYSPQPISSSKTCSSPVSQYYPEATSSSKNTSGFSPDSQYSPYSPAPISSSKNISSYPDLPYCPEPISSSKNILQEPQYCPEPISNRKNISSFSRDLPFYSPEPLSSQSSHLLQKYNPTSKANVPDKASRSRSPSTSMPEYSPWYSPVSQEKLSSPPPYNPSSSPPPVNASPPSPYNPLPPSPPEAEFLSREQYSPNSLSCSLSSNSSSVECLDSCPSSPPS